MADNLPANNYPKFDPKAAASGNNLPATNQSKPPSTHVQQPNQSQQPQQPQQPRTPPNTAQPANVNVNQPQNVLYNLDEYRKIQNAVGFYTNVQNRIDKHLEYHNETHLKWRGIRRMGVKAGLLGGIWGVISAVGSWSAGSTFVGAMIAGAPVGIGLLALTAGILAYGAYAKNKNQEHNRKMGVKDKSGAYTQGSYGAQLDQQIHEIKNGYARDGAVQVNWTQSKGLLDKIHDETSEKRKNNVFWKKAGNIGVAAGAFGTTEMLLGAHILPGGGPALAGLAIAADAVCRLTMNRSIFKLFGKDNVAHTKEKSRLDLFQENIDFHDDQAKRGVLFEMTHPNAAQLRA